MRHLGSVLVVFAILALIIPTSNASDGFRVPDGDIAAGVLTISTPDPQSGVFIADDAIQTVFTLTYTVTGNTRYLTPNAVKLYFANPDSMIKSPLVTAGGANAPDGKREAFASGAYVDLTATLTLDNKNCQQYTKLCAIITYVPGMEDSDLSDDVACSDFGTNTVGVKECTDVVAISLRMTEPNPDLSGFTEGTVTLTKIFVTVKKVGPDGGYFRLKVYFSNDDGTVTSSKVTAGYADGTPLEEFTYWFPSTNPSPFKVSAVLTLDASNCDEYTKLCTVFVFGDGFYEYDSNLDNNEVCINFGTQGDIAGIKKCADDMAAVDLTVISPNPSRSGFFMSGGMTDTIVNLGYTVRGAPRDPEAIHLYFSNDDGTTKSTEVTTHSWGSRLVNGGGTYTGLKASLTLDTENCDVYTRLCANMTFDSPEADFYANNNEICVDFEAGGSKVVIKTCLATDGASYIQISMMTLIGTYFLCFMLF
ncbi:uncharacterized protein LOC144440255 isoform X1 [Glandiceps talaboti]